MLFCLLQGIETAQPGQGHHQYAADDGDGDGGDPRPLASVGHCLKQTRQVAYLLTVSQDSAKNDYPCRFRTLSQ